MKDDGLTSHDFVMQAMPPDLREQIAAELENARNEGEEKSVRRKAYRMMRLTVPREGIPWNPAIDHERCTGCATCLEFCPRSVYEREAGTGRVTVEHPHACVFLCSHCFTLCPEEAISFPDRNLFFEYVQDGRIVFEP